MPKRIKIADHLSLDELERRYRAAKDGVERSHYQIIWQLAQGHTTTEVAELTGYSRSWVYELVWGYNRLGPDSLGDKRHSNPGKAPLLNEAQQAQLWEVLQEPPPDGETWDGPKVALWMSELLGREIHPQRGWEYLKAMKNRRRPRPIQSTDLPAESSQAKDTSKKSRPRLRR